MKEKDFYLCCMFSKKKFLSKIFFRCFFQRPFFVGEDEIHRHRDVHEEQGQHDARGRSEYRG